MQSSVVSSERVDGVQRTLLTFTAGMVINYLMEGRQKKQIRDMFSKYVSPEYVAQHDAIRDGFLRAADHLRPGNHTGDCIRIAYDYIKAAGVPAPESNCSSARV